jgi:drug/metabolite transporter (DMT)-like permease
MSAGSPTRTETGTATAIGFVAVLLWALLALLTASTGSVPPFQLVAMSFTVASAAGLTYWIATGADIAERLRLPPMAWLLGTGGLFGYHFFYFLALRNAPPVEASLIAYLWPLLIVFFSALLPGERLRWFHGAGAIAGFLGAALLVTKGQGFSFEAQYTTGYLAALVCALTWSGYSILSRRFGAIPTSAVGGFCGATAGLAWVCHALFETTVWPTGWEWIAIFALGLGPVGLAFFTWDYGVKRGNIRVLGALSYAAPLLSTLLLIAFGRAEATAAVGLACGLIVGGAVLAGLDFFRPNGLKNQS